MFWQKDESLFSRLCFIQGTRDWVQNWHARLLNKNISSQQKYPQGWIKNFMNHYNILSGIILFQSFRIGMNEWCIDAKDQKQQGYINGFCFVD